MDVTCLLIGMIFHEVSEHQNPLNFHKLYRRAKFLFFCLVPQLGCVRTRFEV